MKRVFAAITGLGLLFGAFWPGEVQAQGNVVWLQIEAHPTLRAAEERARAYAGAFEDVAGFQLASGWYAIVLGPVEPESAPNRLARLLNERLVPGDAFVADGRNFRSRFWPVGTDAQPVAPAQPAEPAQSTAPIEPAEPATPLAAPDTLTADPAPIIAPPTEPLAESRRAEAALSRAQREDIQRALQWFGTYASGIDGAFGPGTRAAITAWQDMEGADGTGVLTRAQTAALTERWRSAVAAIDLRTHADAEAGIEIDLPFGFVDFDSYAPPFVRFAPKAGSGVQVLLISQPGDREALGGLYELLQTLEIMPFDGPRGLRQSVFEITGRNDTRETYAFAEAARGAIKGYLVSWPVERGADMARVLPQMKRSFRASSAQALDPGLVPIDEALRETLVAGLAPRRPALMRSGFFVDQGGTVATVAAAANGCERITIDGGQEMDVASSNSETGIALLRPRAPLAPQGSAAFAISLPALRSEVAVAGFSFEAVLSGPTLTFGTFEAAEGLDGSDATARLALRALPGDAGGPVIDRAGAVVGMLLSPEDDTTRVLPADVAFLLPAAIITEHLAAAGVNATQAQPQNLPLAPEDMTELGNAMAVQVSCWR